MMDVDYELQKDEIAVKFDELLASSKKDDSWFEINSDELHEEVLGFVLDNVKISKVLEELSEDVMLSKDLTQMTEDGCLEHFHSIAQNTNTPASLVASQILAQHLFNVVNLQSKQDTTFHNFLPHDVKQKVKVLLDIINKIEANGTNSFDKLTFIKNLPNKDIPMELVWLLNENSIVSFRTCFLSWYADEEWLERFCESIASFCCDGCQDNLVLREKILQVFVGDLLLLSYGETAQSQEIAKKSLQILLKVIKYAEEQTEKLVSKQINKCRLCLYKIIRELKDVPSDIIHKFFQDVLSDDLTKPGGLTIENAFACQDKWTFEFLSDATRTKYLQSEAVNMKVLCHLLTVFLVHNEEAYKLFDDFLGEYLSECVENCVTLQFHLVLLLRRQAALEGSHISPSYSAWFEQTFVTKGASLGLNTKKTIHFFFKSLTELVPYDQPEFLKVHIFKCPQLPSKLKYYADDYISLAKTRLQDLNIPLEDNTGLFAQSSSNEEHVKVMEQARSDVEKCLSLYEQSGRIPTTIMEASIFRKPYFIGRFLPTLLVPRNLPQEPDVKTRLIDDINRAGKIPAAMFRSYKRKCEQFEDFSNDDKPRDNIQQLTHCLEKLPNLLVDMATGSDATKDLRPWLSSVSRKLKLIFGPRPQESATERIDLDVVALNMDSDSMQASYVIMNVFCRACAAVQNACTSEDTQSNRAISKFRWAAKFVSILVSFPRLIHSLYVHLWSTICHEPHLLSQEHIHGLAILICHLSSVKASYNIHQQSTAKAKSDFYPTFVDFMSSQISLSSRRSAQFFLRWCCHYLQYAMVVFENITTDPHELPNDGQLGFAYVPKTMLIKMEYLYNKLKFKTGEHSGTMFLEKKETEILSLLIKSVHDAESMQSCLSFKQWLIWEINIHEDFLLENERMQYYNWIIYENFLPLSQDGKEQLVACQEMATGIVSCLLDHWTSSQKMQTDRIRSATETNLIKILQDIVSLMSSTLPSQQTSNVWFLVCFISRFSKTEKDENLSSEIQLRCEILAFVRLATQLPPWLFISNSEWGILSDENTKKLSHFLNENLKPWLFQGSLVLPFDFTAHVYKIFFKNLKSGNEKSKNEEELFRGFLGSTPFVFASLMYYWNQLKPLHHGYLTSSETLQHLQSYHAWLDSIFITAEHHTFSQDLVSNEVGQSYAIFLQLLKRIQASILDVKDFLRRLNGLLDRLLVSQSGKRIIIYLWDSIMAYLAAMTFHEDEMKLHDELWHEITKAILFRCSDVLRVFTQEVKQDAELLSARLILFESKSRRLLPVVFFRIFTRQDRHTFQDELPAESFTQAVLLMYIECTDLYQNCSDNTLPSQPLDLETFVKITVFVKDYLRHVQSTVLQSIPKFVVMKLPKEVQRYFVR
ncbi:Hypothetical predicted protein [Paramuricea clavata]|uniref:Uncharacterized protein n=1 Tax=Paramuricea clavata TaxID=317549 RepID=A0A7D9I657_PARCT|nr:Hypothetical predicted protein [Paramuricea clavata]